MIQAAKSAVNRAPGVPLSPGLVEAGAPVTVVIVSYASSGVIGNCCALKAAHDGDWRAHLAGQRQSEGTADRVAISIPGRARRPESRLRARLQPGIRERQSPFVLFMNADVVIGPDDLRTAPVPASQCRTA
jgi:hypothetical protein